MVFDEINATITVKLANSVGTINDESKAEGSVADILSNVVDINLILFFVRDYWKVQAYPRLYDEINIISLMTFENDVDDLFALFNNEIWFFFVVISVGCTAALKYIFKLTLSTALLNFIRMLVNMSIPLIPIDLAAKILLMVLSFTMLVINSFVGSLLTATETVPKIYFAINTMDDLIRSNLTIAGPSTYFDMISQSVIRERYRNYSDVTHCIKDLLNGHPVVCVFEKSIMDYYLPTNASIHKSKANLFERSTTYTVATDWPLLKKFNFVLSRISEAGLIDTLRRRDERYMKSNLYNSKRNVAMIHFFKRFKILFIGWLLSGLTFLLEIFIYLAYTSLYKLGCFNH